MRNILVIVCLAMLAACGGGSGADNDEAEQSPRGKIEQAVDSQQQAKDKARAVEGQVQDAFERQQEAIDKQSGGDDG